MGINKVKFSGEADIKVTEEKKKKSEFRIDGWSFYEQCQREGVIKL